MYFIYLYFTISIEISKYISKYIYLPFVNG